MNQFTPKFPQKILTAIIPLAHREVDYSLSAIPDFLVPVGSKLNALEAAIFECLCVGARSIYIVIDDSEAGITKKIIGDAAYSYGQNDAWFSENFWAKLKRVPIQFVPLSLSDIINKQYNGWGIIRGFEWIEMVTQKLSTYAIPSHYYIKFPFGVFPAQQLVKGRHQMLETSKSTLIRANNISVRNNEPLSACLSLAHMHQMRSRSKYEKNETLEQMFAGIPENELVFRDVEGYSRIDTWASYQDFMASKIVIHAPNTFLRAKTFHEFAGGTLSGSINKQ